MQDMVVGALKDATQEEQRQRIRGKNDSSVTYVQLNSMR